jgi:hypothetical protein
VDEAGTYDMEIKYQMAGDRPTKFDLVFPGESFAFELEAGSPPVHIKDIPLSKGITNFTLTCTSTNPGSDPRLYEMVFSPGN